MFAIVQLGNQQFKVKAGDFIRAPYQNCSPATNIKLPVIAFSDEESLVYDSSQLKKSQVKAIVVRQSLAKKILVFKKKRRKGYRRTRGHRQKITEIQVLELKSPEGRVSKVERKKTSLSTKQKGQSVGKKIKPASSKEEKRPAVKKQVKSVTKAPVAKKKKTVEAKTKPVKRTSSKPIASKAKSSPKKAEAKSRSTKVTKGSSKTKSDKQK